MLISTLSYQPFNLLIKKLSKLILCFFVKMQYLVENFNTPAMKIQKYFPLIVLLFLINTLSQAQNQSYLAHFSNTEQTVYRDNQQRLIMTYQIEGLSSQSNADELYWLFMQHGLFEKLEIKPTDNPNIWNVYEITKPAIKIKDHRKLFVIAGIHTVFINGEPYPADGFTMKMLENEN